MRACCRCWVPLYVLANVCYEITLQEILDNIINFLYLSTIIFLRVQLLLRKFLRKYFNKIQYFFFLCLWENIFIKWMTLRKHLINSTIDSCHILEKRIFEQSTTICRPLRICLNKIHYYFHGGPWEKNLIKSTIMYKEAFKNIFNKILFDFIVFLCPWENIFIKWRSMEKPLVQSNIISFHILEKIIL